MVISNDDGTNTTTTPIAAKAGTEATANNTDNSKALQRRRRCFVLPGWAKTILLAVCIPLVIVTLAVWIFNTVRYKEQWECTSCRADQEPAIKQQFLYFTVWNLWFTSLIVVCWAFGNNNNSKNKAHQIAQTIFRVALPHAAVVFVSYIYYVSTNPSDGFINEDACFKGGRAGLSRSFFDDSDSNESSWLVEFYLVCAYISDYWVHWVSPPLMFLLLITGEFEYDVLVPYNVVFAVVLGCSIGIAQTFSESLVYCGEVWFQVGMTMLFQAIFHVFFVLWHRRIPAWLCGCGCCGTTGDENGKDDSSDSDSSNVEIVVSSETSRNQKNVGDGPEEAPSEP